MAPLEVQGNIIPLKIDTGSDVVIIPKEDWERMRNKPRIHPTNVKLTAYNAGRIEAIGQCVCEVKHKNRKYKILFIVCPGSVKPIIGRKSSGTMGLVQLVLAVEKKQNSRNIDPEKPKVKVEHLTKESIERDYADVFQVLGCLPGKVSIKILDNAEPTIEACRKIPFQQHDQVKKELDKMVEMKVVEKVEKPTEWVNALVIVPKSNGKLRLCLDPRNLNKYIRREHYKLPTREEIMSKFAGAKYFSKLDASSGFWQLELDEESSDLCTFITPFGRYRFKRLPFGVSCAPEVYHRIIHTLFENLSGVDTSMDDIIIWGTSMEEHDERVKQVLEIARKSNLKLNRDKTVIGANELTFLGDMITSEGIRPDNRKVTAIVEMEKPDDKKSLQRFLGMVNDLARFVPELSRRAEPLRKLLNKDNVWMWDQPQQRAFDELKTLVSQEPVLKFYDPNREIQISADASQTGLGAVLLQKHEDEWLPVAYESRTVIEYESRYAPIEREALALTFACERFHQYIYGTTFQAETDHKPLVAIFSKSFNECPPRIQRMRLRLQKYDFRLFHTPGIYMYTADTLSRAAVKGDHDVTTREMNADVEMYVNCIYESLPVTETKLDEIRTATQQDGTLKRLSRVIVEGWPDERRHCTSDMIPYWNFRDELTVINGLVFKGSRIMIPLELRKEMLMKIHHGHLGREKCKKRAREVLFWPNMNDEINNMVESCEVCQKYAMKQQAEPLNRTPVSKSAWEHVSTDLFSLQGKDYIVTCDSYSNYPEVLLLPNQTATSVINALKSIFSGHGIPRILTSGNGPCYNCREFKDFTKEWDIKHVTSSPRYAQSNGLAEKTVQTVKNIMKKCKESDQDVHLALLVYRTTPLENGLSPAELLMGRRLKSNLPESVKVKKTETTSEVIRWREEQEKRQKYYYDKRNHVKLQAKLAPGDQVRVQEPQSWSDRATVVREVGPRSYMVRRNRRHLRLNPDIVADYVHEPAENDEPDLEDDVAPAPPAPVLQPDRTRSGRTVNKPNRLIEQC